VTSITDSINSMTDRQARTVTKACEARLRDLERNARIPNHFATKIDVFGKWPKPAIHASDDMLKTMCGKAIGKDWKDYRDCPIVTCKSCRLKLHKTSE
jgi:hypothetical protein